MLFTSLLTLGGAGAGSWYTFAYGFPIFVPILTLSGCAVTVVAMVVLICSDPGHSVSVV